MILLLLQKGVKSLQSRLAEFFEGLAADEEAPGAVTAGAWTQARAKLSYTTFIELNEEAVLGSFYGPDNQAQVRRWCGHRLGAIDGSLVPPPRSEALGGHFGWVDTANGGGPCAVLHVMARASVYFDVLNRLALDARLEPARTAERQLGALHPWGRCARATWCPPIGATAAWSGFCGCNGPGRTSCAGCRGAGWRPPTRSLRPTGKGVSLTVELRANGRAAPSRQPPPFQRRY